MANVSKFFSAALEAAQNLKQKRGTAQQMRSMLLQGGAKPKELEYIGVDDFMKHWGSRKDRLGPSVDDTMTRDQLVDYIDTHQVKPEEVKKVGVGDDEAAEERVSEITGAVIRAQSANPDEAAEARKVFKELTGEDYKKHMWNLDDFDVSPADIANHFSDRPMNPQLQSKMDSIWDEVYNAAHNEYYTGSGDTKWSQYVTGEPSDKYTEHLVTIPPPGVSDKVWKDQLDAGLTEYEGVYRSPHWEEGNVLAHMRYDYDPDALRLEEIQSDWLQQAREKGFKMDPAEVSDVWRKIEQLSAEKDRLTGKGVNAHYGSLTDDQYAQYGTLSDEINKLKHDLAGNVKRPPRAPLANMNDWTAMMVRRAMLEAAENDLPKLRWTSGAMQDSRYSPEAGRAKYYDEVIPNIVKKIAKPYGEAVIRPGIPERTSPRNRTHWDSEFHEAELPPKLIEALQKRGKVPFFKYGGEVE